MKNIMKCLECKKQFTPKRNAHNVKYCSQLCRNRLYYRNRNGAEYQRLYLAKKLEESGMPLIKCEICGKRYRQVGSHVYLTHGMTAREYREEYGFDVKRGQLPEDYRQLKAEQVFENGTVENLKKGKKNWFKKGGRGVGVYTRSPQTLERLKLLSKYKKICKK